MSWDLYIDIKYEDISDRHIKSISWMSDVL